MDDRIRVTPCACFSHDDQGGRIRIDLELPGVDKKDISPEMRMLFSVKKFVDIFKRKCHLTYHILVNGVERRKKHESTS